jgi:hypothetical protein
MNLCFSLLCLSIAIRFLDCRRNLLADHVQRFIEHQFKLILKRLLNDVSSLTDLGKVRINCNLQRVIDHWRNYLHKSNAPSL